MMAQQVASLRNYIGSQVRIEGVYNGKDNRYSNRYTVVLEDVQVFDLKGTEIEWDKDHTWVQDAWRIGIIKELQVGDRVYCTVTVTTYLNKHGEKGISFTDPMQVEWQSRC